MLVELAGKLWRRMPKRFRRWGVLLTESRFTVTAGAVVTDEQNRVLLLQHRFRPGFQQGGGWGIPGGFLQSGEQPEEAIRRELREEISLEVDVPKVAFVRALGKYNQIEIIFRCHPRGVFQLQSREISRAEWFALDSLPQTLSDDQRALINQATSCEHL